MTRIVALFLLLVACAVADNDVGSWNVTDKDGEVCLRMQAKITFIIKYESNDLNDTTTVQKTATVVMHTNETERFGNCDMASGFNTISFTFFKDNGWNLALTFAENKTSNTFALSNIVAGVNFKPPPKIFDAPKVDSMTQTYKNGTPSLLLHSPVGKSYKCEHGDTTIFVSSNPDKSSVSVRFDSLRVQPFNGNATTFIDGDQCDADSAASDLVPIIVGACLALLVVIVLIAYLIGRVRAKRQGYSSV